jgi:uncharacterized membrane protein YdbT with pleckstrin-like domain
MEENTYQKLGSKTLIYDVVIHSLIPVIILLVVLGLTLVKNSTDPTGSASNVSAILDFLVYWGVLIALVFFVVTFFVSWLAYTTFQFRLDADIFKIKRGVFTKQEIAIPYRRIESVDIKRNLIQQLFGVSRINIETTIDSQSSGDDKNDANEDVFPVIDHSLAETIQEELTKRANVQKMQV